MMVHQNPTTSATREPPLWTTQRLLTSHAVLWTRGARRSIWLCWASLTDEEARRTRRNLQRSTCWRFPGVATRANDFTGAMLVLYVLGRHPSHGYDYSAALLEERAVERCGCAANERGPVFRQRKK
ncbi:hypothetical protein TcBrA4_0053180 [Trypanosoma cruzi]|nr:hypothetical protein TcBrA4_0053180 [Trypanosoma cruzi]